MKFLKSILSNRIPGQVVIQITDRCNARCPQCGMRATEKFSRSTLQSEKIKRTIDAAAKNGVAAVSFTGGEPLLDIDRLTELIRYAGDAGIPYIRTGTNGFVFSHSDKKGFTKRIERIAKKLAGTPLRNFWISLDSAVDDVHEGMRGFHGIVAGIEKALPIFHDNGIYPAANLGINRNVGGVSTRHLERAAFDSQYRYLAIFHARYQNALERFFQRAIDLGFTMANCCYPMSIDEQEAEQGLNAVYAATTVDDIVRFTRSEKQVLFQALIRAITRYRPKIRIFSPLCSLQALVRQYGTNDGRPITYGCRGGVDFFFVNAADGYAYPCGYRGEEKVDEFAKLDLERLRPLDKKEACRQCDWECFRDPSELMGPILEIVSNPLGLIRRVFSHPETMIAWMKDLAYYRACKLFDGRRPPDASKLRQYDSLFRHAHEKARTAFPIFLS
jgi:MoaA/NifB/PqqE/SkfB family radical SAM enzyme